VLNCSLGGGLVGQLGQMGIHYNPQAMDSVETICDWHICGWSFVEPSIETFYLGTFPMRQRRRRKIKQRPQPISKQRSPMLK
jgi:hypothetical protein